MSEVELKEALETESPELDEVTKVEVIKAIEHSLKGEPINDHQATLLFYWARHQDDKAFSFVPKKYRLNASAPKPRKRKTPIGQ